MKKLPEKVVVLNCASSNKNLEKNTPLLHSLGTLRYFCCHFQKRKGVIFFLAEQLCGNTLFFIYFSDKMLTDCLRFSVLS